MEKLLEIRRILNSQKKFFSSSATLNLNVRLEYLRKLQLEIEKNQFEIASALKKDLGKSNFEAYLCEVGMVLSELNFMRKNLKKFAKDNYVKTPLAQFPAKSFEKSSPYGTVLIVSPWNYPFLLSISPLVDAIAAGNTAVIKPSNYSPATSLIIKKIIENVFPQKYCAVILGGREENQLLLEQKFDYIFFTGSKEVGKLVLEKAAPNLTPVTLELGGKSPCIVDKSSNLEIAARRIVFGKFLNCGQTCVAPDYILCHRSVVNKLIPLLKQEIIEQFGKNPLKNQNYGKIVNEKHFKRLLSLIDENKIVFGGLSNEETNQISPTILANVNWNDAVMQEEIFGPILPILVFDDISEVISVINSKDKPLALYIFAENKILYERVLNECSFGGGCVNDTIIHLASSELRFGGVGESGMGSYHGKAGFDTFSHKKSIVNKATWLDLPFRYQPYSKEKFDLVKFFLK